MENIRADHWSEGQGAMAGIRFGHGHGHGLASLVALTAMIIVSACGGSEGPSPARAADEPNRRVERAFAGFAEGIAAKEGVNGSLRYRLGDQASLPDGTTASLWVLDEQHGTSIASRCFWVDFVHPKGDGDGLGGCGLPTTMVNVDRQGLVGVGSVGTWPASRVRIEAAGSATEVIVSNGYFLVASDALISAPQWPKIELLRPEGAVVATVHGFDFPGVATPVASGT